MTSVSTEATDEDVLRLDVAMDDAARVCERDRVAGSEHVRDQREPCGQGRAIHEALRAAGRRPGA